MLRLMGVTLLAASGALLSPLVHAEAKAAPANPGLKADVWVNGQAISENHVRLMTGGFDKNANGTALNNADARAAARAELITEEVLAQEARRLGLDRQPAVTDLLAYQSREILARAYLEDHFDKNPVTEASLRTTYEWNRANGKIVEYKLRQILVDSSDEAAALITKLNKGADFIELAKQNTRDPGGQNTGGDLGWFRPDIFVDHHFTSAVTALKKGEYNKAPVRSRFGWHIIKVEDGPRPVSKPEPFDALSDNAKEALRQKTVQQQIETLTSQLTAKAKITSGTNGAAVARNEK